MSCRCGATPTASTGSPSICLHPADLGMVSLVAEVRDGAVHLQLAGGSDAAREALREALPDLRRELEQGGFTRCSLDLSQDTAPGGHRPGPQPTPWAPAASGPATPTRESTVDDIVPAASSTRRLDLRI
jgi:hypothetical protein